MNFFKKKLPFFLKSKARASLILQGLHGSYFTKGEFVVKPEQLCIVFFEDCYFTKGEFVVKPELTAFC